MQSAHQKRRRHALAGNITDQKIEIACISADQITIVTAELSRRFVMIKNFPAVELEILFRQELSLNKPCAAQVIIQFGELFRRQAAKTVSRQRICIHHGLADHLVTNLADAVGLRRAQTLNRAFHFTQESVQFETARRVIGGRL